MPEARSFGDQAIEEYLEQLASDAPSPGGGSGVAVAGAIAAALAGKVISISGAKTQGRSKLDRFADLRTKVTEARQTLMTLSDEDATAYGAYVAATRLPRATEAEKQRRRQEMDAALLKAVEVPLGVMETAETVTGVLRELADAGAKHVLADVRVAVALLEAVMTGCQANVRANLAMLRDDSARHVAEGRMQTSLERHDAQRRRALAVLEERESTG